MTACATVRAQQAAGDRRCTCSHQDELLVLLRNSKHNNNTWGLPGGNADREDEGDLRQTAIREAREEMEVLPEYDVVGQARHAACASQRTRLRGLTGGALWQRPHAYQSGTRASCQEPRAFAPHCAGVALSRRYAG